MLQHVAVWLNVAACGGLHWAVHVFQMKPTRCTLIVSIFIPTPLHVSGNCVPIIRRTYCIYATPVFFTLYGWLFGLPTRQPPIQSTQLPVTCREFEINILTISVYLVGFIWNRLYRDVQSTAHKIGLYKVKIFKYTWEAVLHTKQSVHSVIRIIHLFH